MIDSGCRVEMARIYYSDTEGGGGEAAYKSTRSQSIFTEWPVSYRCIRVTDCRLGWWNQPSAIDSIMMMQDFIRDDSSTKSRKTEKTTSLECSKKPYYHASIYILCILFWRGATICWRNGAQCALLPRRHLAVTVTQ